MFRVERRNGAGAVGGVEVKRRLRQHFLRLIPLPPAAHVRQNERNAPQFAGDMQDHLRRAEHLRALLHVKAGMHERDQAQPRCAVENPEIARIVQPDALEHRMQLDALHPGVRDARQLTFPPLKIRVHAAEGKQARLLRERVGEDGTVVDAHHLLRTGGHGQHGAQIYACLLPGAHEPGGGPIRKRAGAGGTLELVHRQGGDLERENMRVDIQNHKDRPFP